MQVKMRTTMSGDYGTAQVGDVVTVPDPIAKELILGGYAEPVKQVPERAVLEPAENATLTDNQFGTPAPELEEEKPLKPEPESGPKPKKK